MKTKVVKVPFEIEIPHHWTLVSNREIFEEHNIRGLTNLDLLSVSQSRGVTPQSEVIEKKDISNEDKSNYKHVGYEYIVYNKMRMWQGAVGVSKYEGIVSPAYVVLKKRNNQVIPDYFHYQFRSDFFVKQSGIFSYGLCDDMNSLRYEDFKNMKSILPSKEEQQIIVGSVNNSNDLIDLFIKWKLKYITLLKEYKQSKINEIVTKGLNPNIKLKDSGIKWLGKIPEQWRIMKLNKLVTLNSSSSQNKTNKIALENIESWTGKLIKSNNIPFEGNGVSFEKGDILFCKLRPYLAKAYLPTVNGVCVNELLVFKPKVNLILKEFLYTRLLTYDFIQLVNSSTYGAKMPRANWDFIGEIEIPFPASNDEQIQIYEMTEQIKEDINALIKKAMEQIELIQEYKKSFIYELVTGKRKP